ncbi:hypothetical protein [uncultured Chryseobacterium sp.]
MPSGQKYRVGISNTGVFFNESLISTTFGHDPGALTFTYTVSELVP